MRNLDALKLVLFVALMIGIGWWMKIQWHECREAGLSVLYCLQHIG